MSSARARSKAVIAGIGQTDFSKNSGRTELHLACEAIKLALDDAGLVPADIDGMSTFTIDNNEDVDIVRSMGIKNLRFSSRAPHGGGGSMATIAHGMAAVEAGLSNTFVCFRAMNERSEARFGTAHMTPNSNSTGSGSGFLEWSMPYGAMTPAAWTGIQAQRYMERYGLTNADFAPISVQLRKNASTNPLAWFYEKPITIEDHQNSRWIVDPIFRLLDCCQESDGGVALVITTEERARDLRQKPARISHATQAVPFETETVTNFYHQDLTTFDSGVHCGRELFGRTGLTPSDIQVGMLYDHFTIAVFWHLEAMGFCKPGEAADFVKDGNLALDGSIPLSPNGGLIGEAYIHGMNLATEAVRQIRGTATNQVADVENVLLSAGMSGAILSVC